MEAFPDSVICASRLDPCPGQMCTHSGDFQERRLETFERHKGQLLDTARGLLCDSLGVEPNGSMRSYKHTLASPMGLVESVCETEVS